MSGFGLRKTVNRTRLKAAKGPKGVGSAKAGVWAVMPSEPGSGHNEFGTQAVVSSADTQILFLHPAFRLYGQSGK